MDSLISAAVRALASGDALRDPDVCSRMNSMGFDPVGASPIERKRAALSAMGPAFIASRQPDAENVAVCCAQ